jgi:hypothetical protein
VNVNDLASRELFFSAKSHFFTNLCLTENCSLQNEFRLCHGFHRMHMYIRTRKQQLGEVPVAILLKIGNKT